MKHEYLKFEWNGYKYAPESYRFYCNGNIINLDDNQHSTLAYLAVCGKNKEVEDFLKRLYRKELKNGFYTTFKFFEYDKTTCHYTRDLLRYNANLQDRLYIYKTFKNYIIDNDYNLSNYTVKVGEVLPDGTIKKLEEKAINHRININHFKSMKFYKEKAFRIA